MQSSTVRFKVKKGDSFTSAEFKEALHHLYNDRELRILFTFVIRAWKEKGLITEEGSVESVRNTGQGKRRKVYQALADIVFEVGAKDSNTAEE